MDAITSQHALTIQRRYGIDAGRMYRAAEIVNKGHIRRLPSGVFEVISQSRAGKTHKVNPHYESCSCEDCTAGNLCIHLAAWKLLTMPEPCRDVIAEREQQVKAKRVKTEWHEEAFV